MGLNYLIFAFSIFTFLTPAETWALTATKNQRWHIVPDTEKQPLIQQLQSRHALHRIDPEEIESIQKLEDGVVAILRKDGSTAFYATGENIFYNPAPRETRNKKDPGGEVIKTSRQETIRKFLLTELASLSQQEPYPKEEIDYLVSNLRSEYIYLSHRGDLFPLIDALKDLPPRTEIINLEADLIGKFVWEMDDEEKIKLVPRIYELMTLAEPIKNPPGDKKDDNVVRFYTNSKSYEYTFNAELWKDLFSSYMAAKAATDANPQITNPIPPDKIIETLRAKGVIVEEIVDERNEITDQ